jgi:RNA polymerase sigma-70 factor, ECF subfamily
MKTEALLNSQPDSCCSPAPETLASPNLCEQVWDIWQEHAKSLRQFLLQRTREQALTDDLLSEVMLKAYKNCERLHEARDVRAWLGRVAQNTLTDYYRKKKESSLPADDRVTAAPTEGPLPEQQLANYLAEVLLLLPEADRLPLQWADLEGLPQEQVARRLGISLSGAKSRIQRARLKLRQQIEACCAVETDSSGRIADYYAKGNC